MDGGGTRRGFRQLRVRWPAASRRQDAPAWRTAVETGSGLKTPRHSVGGHDAVRRRITFHRMLRKLSKHRRRLRGDATPESPPARRKRGGAGTDTGGARGVARRLGGRPVARLLPPIGSFRSNEVLAINLSPEGLAKVRDGSYEPVGEIELPEFGLTITRLRTPESVNAVSGWGRLYDLLPEGGFALNRIYAPYRLGAGPGPAAAGIRSAAHGKGCAADRCFGTGLINWHAPLGACARGVKVGVIDTGFDKRHPAFAGLSYEYKEFLPEGSARAAVRHGTGVLSLLAGNPGSGTPGLIPDAHFVVANAFFAGSNGQAVSDTAQMLRAMHWLKKKDVSVANLSFAGPHDELLHHGVQQLTRAGIVVIAAAGNEGPRAPPSYPAAYEEVIAVTAIDRNLAAYRYANRGDHIDVAAPGVEVWTALPGRREGPQTGTSFAVPYVTAIVAIADSAAGLRPAVDPLASGLRALALLNRDVKRLGAPGHDPTFGAGLVQAPAVCDAIVPETVAATEPWAGTVRRVFGTAAREPLVVGAWASTVHAASGNEVRR